MYPETNESARPDNATDPRPAAPSPSLAAILAGWQAQGKIEIVPLATVAADLAAGRLSPLVAVVR